MFTGKQKVEKPVLQYFHYNESDFKEIPFTLEARKNKDPSSVEWLDVRGLHDIKLIDQIGNEFKIHPLALEDILDVHHRPKLEHYEAGLFVVLKDFKFDPENLNFSTEQISIFFGPKFVVSFQEDVADDFSSILDRLSRKRGKIRKSGSDYLAYALIDKIVDNYLVSTDHISEIIDQIEQEITLSSRPAVKSKIHRLKRELIHVRKTIGPLRELINGLIKSDVSYIEDNTTLFFRDVYDHTIQASELIETYRDMLSGLHELYISEMSFRMNQIMKVLTIIATIFIPLTFLAGIYGMNFDYMPELHWQYGYFYLLGFMLMVGVILLIFFRWKRWL